MQPGTQLGHYEIITAIGKGGMGEVWRAKDTKLGREVAIKTLPPEFAQDADRLARFEREAKLLASLNHPNIAAIYGLEEHEGSRFLVLELVEGDTLGERIKRGAIPVEESLRLALQIADALKAAHESGVIHRDLKPDNIKVSDDGNVKVLDFGLAKALAADDSEVNASNSPTLSMAATQAGMILGTAAYMSPEQAKGRAVDRRADVWAFGAVLYEMLSGRQSFGASDVTESLAAVITLQPKWDALPANLNLRLRETVERCLEKQVAKRYQDIGDVKVDIETVLADPSGVIIQPAFEVVHSAPQSKLPWVVAAFGLGLVIAGVAVWTLKPEAPAPVVRFSHVLPESQQLLGGANRALTISEDGSKLVYVANNQLYLRAMDTLESIPIPGTEEDPRNPFFSPDGQWIGYLSGADAQLKKIAVGGGAAVTLANVDNTLGPPRWGTDDYVVFTGPEGLMRVSANGGTPQIMVEGTGLGAPQLLPDGETVLGSLGSQIGLLPESGEPEALFAGGRARYVRTGHIIYGLEGVLLAVPFDAGTLEVGGAVPLVEGVRFDGGFAQYDLSDSGSLAYVQGDFAADSYVLALVDRNGVTETLEVPPQSYYAPRISPDGTRLAVEVRDGDGSGIFVYDLSGNTNIRRLTQTLEGNNTLPLWTVDSERVTFTSDRDGTLAIYWQSADGTDLAERLFLAEEGTSGLFLTGWSPDGRTLAFTMDSRDDRSLWILSLDGEAEPEATLFYDVPGRNEYSATFSPDGNWLAYSVNSPRAVFVEPFPRTGSIYQVTDDGLEGRKPLWSADGTELFYQRNNPTRLAAVDITTVGGITNGSERPLPIQGFLDTAGYRGYDTTPDSQRFVVALPATLAAAGEPLQPQINVVLNWFQELRERVPVD